MRFWKVIDLNKACSLDSLKNHLGNAVADLNLERLALVSVQKGDLDLTAVPRVNSAWAVQHFDSVLGCETAAGVYEPNETVWNCNANAGGNRESLARLDHASLRTSQVTPGITWMCVNGYPRSSGDKYLQVVHQT
jgi:type III secretory pathway lipoprotein EscJ